MLLYGALLPVPDTWWMKRMSDPSDSISFFCTDGGPATVAGDWNMASGAASPFSTMMVHGPAVAVSYFLLLGLNHEYEISGTVNSPFFLG